MSESKKGNHLHDGHRDRMKARFHKEGLENFDQHQVLEMLLFFGVHMKDTNDLAHELLNAFGSLYQVMEASYEDLLQIKGVTPNVATLICFSQQLARRYWVDRCDVGEIMDSSYKLGEYVKYKFMGERVESFLVISMDNRGKLLNCTRIAVGSVNVTNTSIRAVLHQALKDNATMVAVAHNHPNGHAYPSTADVNLTKELAEGLLLAEIRLLDHIIVSEDDYISMADTQALAPIFTARYASTDTVINLIEKRDKQ